MSVGGRQPFVRLVYGHHRGEGAAETKMDTRRTLTPPSLGSESLSSRVGRTEEESSWESFPIHMQRNWTHSIRTSEHHNITECRDALLCPDVGVRAGIQSGPWHSVPMRAHFGTVRTSGRRRWYAYIVVWCSTLGGGYGGSGSDVVGRRWWRWWWW